MTAVDLVTGFLGEGKTTFLQGYGAWLTKQGISFAVVENEFGAAGVDAALLTQNGMEVRELSGGCICCTLPVTFHDTLLALSQEFQRIIIEPSGIFNPQSFFSIMASPSVAACATHGAMLAILDPATLDTLSSADKFVLADELRQAGQIILSKVDTVTNELRQLIAATLNPLLSSDEKQDNDSICSRIYPKALLSLGDEDYKFLQQFQPRESRGEISSVDHTTLFESTTLYPKESYHPEQIRTAMKILSHCGRISRVKGYLLGESGGFLVNVTPNGETIVPTDAPQSPMINIIGRQLDRREIQKLFR